MQPLLLLDLMFPCPATSGKTEARAPATARSSNDSVCALLLTLRSVPNLFIMSYVRTVSLHKHTAGHIEAWQIYHVAEFCISSKEQALCITWGQRLELLAVMLLPHQHLMRLGQFVLNGLVSCRILCRLCGKK